MTRRYGLIDRESWQPFFSLLLFCGIGLLVTIPPARYVRDFDRIAFLPGVPIYLYAYAVFMGILGLNLGAISAARGERGWVVIPLLTGRIFLAQCLVLPYFVFARALYPGREVAFVLIILYTTIVCLLCAVTSRLIEGQKPQGTPRGFVLKYALYTIYCVVPLLGVPVLSPLGAVLQILNGEEFALLLVAYGVPVVLAAGVVLLLHRRLRGDANG